MVVAKSVVLLTVAGALVGFGGVAACTYADACPWMTSAATSPAAAPSSPSSSEADAPSPSATSGGSSSPRSGEYELTAPRAKPKAASTTKAGAVKPSTPRATVRPTPKPSATPRKPPRTPRPTVSAAAGLTGPAAQVLRITNTERAKAGCSPLTPNAQLIRAAQDHSTWQASTRTMSHTGKGGSDPGDRARAAGYDWRAYGENVAFGQTSSAQVMTAWMNSPGHRQNIENCTFRELGVGVKAASNGALYWTQLFGTAL